MRSYLVIPLLLLPIAAQASSRKTVTTTKITSCDQLRVEFSGDQVAVESEEVALPSGNSLHLSSSTGGVHVIGTTDGRLAVTACKVGAADTLEGARAKAHSLQVRAVGNEVSASGPARDDEWGVFFLVRAPKDSQLQIESANGEISFDDLAGGIYNARAKNGPISIASSTGQIDAGTINGPIDLANSGGTFNLSAENGPISVALSGSRWSGSSLVAKTENGPLTVNLPSGYGSPVLVESRGSGPISCRGCGAAKQTSDEGVRRITFGSGNPLVTLSTINGPVSVTTK